MKLCFIQAFQWNSFPFYFSFFQKQQVEKKKKKKSFWYSTINLNNIVPKNKHQNKMQCYNLLKAGWSLRLREKYLGTAILSPNQRQLQVYTSIWKPLELSEQFNSMLEKHHPVSVFELISSHQPWLEEKLSPMCLQWPPVGRPHSSTKGSA